MSVRRIRNLIKLQHTVHWPSMFNIFLTPGETVPFAAEEKHNLKHTQYNAPQHNSKQNNNATPTNATARSSQKS